MPANDATSEQNSNESKALIRERPEWDRDSVSGWSNEDEVLPRPANRPSRYTRERSNFPTLSKRVKQEDQEAIYISSDSDDEVASDLLATPAETVGSSARGPPVYTPLPEGITIETWRRDFDIAVSSNAKPGSIYFKENWDTYNLGKRQTLAHARLIHGAYGIDCPRPCTNCISAKSKEATARKICRVYHPDIRRAAPSKWKFGFMCAPCRGVGSGCDIENKVSI